jgi:hypothetical protein
MSHLSFLGSTVAARRALDRAPSIDLPAFRLEPRHCAPGYDHDWLAVPALLALAPLDTKFFEYPRSDLTLRHAVGP